MGVPYQAEGGLPSNLVALPSDLVALPLNLVALPLGLEGLLMTLEACPWKQGAFQVEEASCLAAPFC